MGVQAVIRVRLPEPMDDATLTRLAYEMAGAFGDDVLEARPSGGPDGRSPRVARWDGEAEPFFSGGVTSPTDPRLRVNAGGPLEDGGSEHVEAESTGSGTRVRFAGFADTKTAMAWSMRAALKVEMDMVG